MRNEKIHAIVELNVILNEKLDKVNNEFLNLSEFLNHNDHVVNSLQGKMKVVHFEEYDSDMP